MTVESVLQLIAALVESVIAARASEGTIGTTSIDVDLLIAKVRGDDASNNAAAHAELDARFPR